jgi:hypothetical protein
MKGVGLMGLAAVFGLLIAGPAWATTNYGWLELTYDHCGPTEAARTSLNSGSTWDGPWYTGQYNLKVNSASSSHSVGDTGEKLWGNAAANNWLIGSYCIDIRQQAPTSGAPPAAPYRRYDLYDLQDAPIVRGMDVDMGTAKADDLRRLFSNWSSAWATTGYVKNGWNGDQYAAAFEAAVWEIINETATKPGGAYDYNLGLGTFRVSEYWGGSWGTIANGWFANLQDMAPNLNVVALVNEDFQDYALTVADFGSRESPIPEPVTMAGLMLGICGLARYVRRNRRTA